MARLIRFPGGQQLIVGPAPSPELVEQCRDPLQPELSAIQPPDNVAVQVSTDELWTLLADEFEQMSARGEPVFSGQYAITVNVVQDGRYWKAESAEMPEMELASTSRGTLLAEVFHNIHAAHGDKKGTITIKLPLSQEP
jgi:hypothetical protein